MKKAIERLYDAVLEQSEYIKEEESWAWESICEHGADGGWSGFTMTQECVDFYEKHEDDIYDLLDEQADSLGCSSVDEMVSGFVRKDMLNTPDGRKNLLAWFALEEVARWFTDKKERVQA